ncbi:hypothetical protein [Allohahella sp. A8]|uniref:hypothetical protein n=1 Tax=Allohahella sp. A8 TaxID=3141461 RepID=UPI0026AD5CC1|tara:strand:- start:458 stop:673 length:216 start_codon:yes stop_codon:yes gene_type:complete
MKDRIESVEQLIRAAISDGRFTDIQEAQDAVQAWLKRGTEGATAVAASLKGDMTEEGDADYQDQAMRSVDA